MLQSIRDRAQGWLAYVIIGLIIIPFALWGIQEYLGTGSETEVANVNGTSISQRQFQQSYEQQRQRIRSLLGKQASSLDEANMKQSVVDGLIRTELLRQFGNALHFRVGDVQLAKQIQSMPEFQDNDRFSKDRFTQLLRQEGLTAEGLEALVRYGLLNQQINAGITTTAFVAQRELNQTIQLQNQQREIGYLILPSANFIQDVVVSEAAVSEYYERHRDSFVNPEQVSIDYLELSANDLAAGVQIDEQELRKLYEEQRIAPKPFEEARAELEKEYRQRKGQQQFFEKAEPLTNMVYESPDTLDIAAKELGLQVKTTALFTRKGGEGLTAEPKITSAAFSNEVLGQGYNSEPIEIGDNHLVVLRVKEHKKSSARSSQEEKQAITTLLRTKIAQERAQVAGASIQQRLHKGEEPQIIAKEYQVMWEQPTPLRRDSADIDAVIVRTAFAVGKPAKTNSKGSRPAVGGATLESGDYAVIAVFSVQEGSFAPSESAARLALQRQLQRNQAEYEYRNFVAELKKQAKIIVHQDKL